MSWEKPSWYMTTDEFADLVVHSLEVTHHFKRGEKVHPEDIVAAFVTAAETIGIGAGAVGKKMWVAEKKNAIMTTTNMDSSQTLIKSHEEIAEDGDYSEHKWRNVKVK